MAITLKSVFQTADNNIVLSSSRSKGSLGTVKREYNDIVKFLDLQKNQIEIYQHNLVFISSIKTED